ncbi:MAG: mismatch-specific DNA-glycosylase [Armatimonadetes bacterium]|nr:mismatch-specific DNA-glycosylase [Armatimonadota bacterium]
MVAPPPATASPILPDLLAPGLRVVFCGMAAGSRSALLGRYYAGPGNKFWAVIQRIGLTPYPLRPDQFPLLPSWGIGLTDLVKTASGPDRAIRPADPDRALLQAKITRHAPFMLAFNGKRAAKEFLRRPVDYGIQEERIGETRLWALPSTSGAASGFWDETHWRDLAAFLGVSP